MGTRRRPQGRTCRICGKPFKAGEATRRANLVEGDHRPYAVHERCFEEDWPRIEVGLEHFEPVAGHDAKP
jgi:hypothetical protein